MDELISRQSAIDALRDYLVGKICPDDGTLTCRLIENEVINKLPTIHPELGTNLAEVGTDCISRAAAIDAIDEYLIGRNLAADGTMVARLINEMVIKKLPSSEPGIIYCKDCVKYNRRIGDFKEMPNGEIIWCWKYNACPLAEFRGKAQGHEFDYQFCVYAERRKDG